MTNAKVSREEMLEWLYQAIAMRRREDGLRVICDEQWNADMRSAIRALIESAPAPLPAEVEEAIGNLCLACGEQENCDGCIRRKVCLHKKALAILRSALNPKRVTREWVEAWANTICSDSDYVRETREDLTRMVRELGVEVEDVKT
jgi:hypothetical protein